MRHFWASTTQTVIHGRRHWGVMKFRCLRYIISAGDAVAMLALGGVASMAAAAMAPTPMLDNAAARRGGFQPTELGGKGTLAGIFNDRGNQMLMAAALSPERWSFSLAEWFYADRGGEKPRYECFMTSLVSWTRR